jgi:hypothetical protein
MENPERLAREALTLVEDDGEWPSAAYEEGPHARRAQAMQEAIKNLAQAVLILAAQRSEP